jgi:hypothetical protein
VVQTIAEAAMIELAEQIAAFLFLGVIGWIGLLVLCGIVAGIFEFFDYGAFPARPLPPRTPSRSLSVVTVTKANGEVYALPKPEKNKKEKRPLIGSGESTGIDCVRQERLRKEENDEAWRQKVEQERKQRAEAQRWKGMFP